MDFINSYIGEIIGFIAAICTGAIGYYSKKTPELTVIQQANKTMIESIIKILDKSTEELDYRDEEVRKLKEDLTNANIQLKGFKDRLSCMMEENRVLREDLCEAKKMIGDLKSIIKQHEDA